MAMRKAICSQLKRFLFDNSTLQPIHQRFVKFFFAATVGKKISARGRTAVVKFLFIGFQIG